MVGNLGVLPRKTFFAPRNLLFSYLLLTVIMFSISPWEWPLENPLLFYFFNIFFLLAFYGGYNLGYRKYKLKEKSKFINLKKYISISLIVSLLFIYPKFLFKLKVPFIGLGELFNSIIIGFVSPATAYAAKHQSDYSEFLTLSNPLVLFYIISLPLQYFVVPLGVFYWKQLNAWQKASYFTIVLTDVLSYIAIGTNKGIFDYIILVPLMLVAANPSIFNYKFYSKKFLKFFALAFIVLSLGIFYFVEGNKGRKKDNFEYDYAINKGVNKDATVLVLLPNSLQDPYIALDSYITQGYYAMGLAINLDTQFTYGLGHNSFFTILGEKIVGGGVIQKKTYQARLEKKEGYNSMTRWHSFYVWMANDFTFFGVILIVFFIGYFLSQVWIDILGLQNPFAIILLPLFFTMILYFPANNQILGNQGSSIIFWFFFILWHKSKGRKFIYSK